MPVLVALATVVSTALGGVVVLRSGRRLHLILGFTAGVMLGLVAFDLLPEVFSLAHGSTFFGVPPGLLMLAVGFLVLHVVEKSVSLHGGQESAYDHHHHPHVGLVSAIALAGHSFLDGVGIGLGFQASKAVGIAVAIAVIAHDFADGMNTVGVMMLHGNTRRPAITMLVIDALAPLLGAFSTLFFSVPEGALGLYLGFFAGFLLYLATGDILPEAHRRHSSWQTMAATVLGAGLMWTVVGLS